MSVHVLRIVHALVNGWCQWRVVQSVPNFQQEVQAQNMAVTLNTVSRTQKK